MRHTVECMLALCVTFTSFGPQRVAAQGITHLDIRRVESPTFEGRTFGSVGAYEKLAGRAFGELDPRDPHSAVIVTIDRAPVNARGMVEHVADFYILKPVDLQRGNRTLFYNMVNRGNKRSGGFMIGTGGGNDPTTADDAGDGLLMSEGFTLVWSGWQGDLDARHRSAVDRRTDGQERGWQSHSPLDHGRVRALRARLLGVARPGSWRSRLQAVHARRGKHA